jgi:hypothetical protein
MVATFDLTPGDNVGEIRMPRAGGRFAVVTRWSTGTASASLERVDLEAGTTTLLLENASHARFFDNGHVAFQRNETWWVAPFDLDRAELTGEARPCLSGTEDASFDRDGERVVYRVAGRQRPTRTIVIMDESGSVIKTLVDTRGDYQGLSMSPDGRRLAYVKREEAQARIWVLDIASGLTRPVSPEREWAYLPEWMPDGRLAYSRWVGANVQELMAMDATPGAIPERLLPMNGEGRVLQDEATFSPDGRYVICSHVPRDGREPGVYLFDVGDGDSGRAFFASQGLEGAASFRPDGKWVSYNANASGRYEVYLRPFEPEHPEDAPIYPVSQGGGTWSIWSADGKTLYYRGLEANAGTLYAVTVETEPEVTISEPRVVLAGLSGDAPLLTVMPGGRFAVAQSAQGTEDPRPQLRLILNWGLGRKSP